MRFTVPFRLLEINVLSAQDLSPSSRSVQTYAIAWIHPDRKLTTRVDTTGRSNPVWNEKFVFRVDDEFLQSNTSAITVEIYKVGWLKKDTRIGTVNAFMANLLPPAAAIGEENKPFDTRYVALQVRRSSKRPQGILNLGVSLLDNTFHSMPLQTDDLDSSKQDQLAGSSKRSAHDDSKVVNKLRRSNSDMTDRTTDPQRKVASVVNTGASIVNGSIPTGSMINGGSMVNGGGNGSMCTDVGPSASVVAAAIARGIYPLGPTKNNQKSEGERLIIWNGDEKEHGVEGLKTKMDRWRTEMPVVQDYPVVEKERSAAKKRAERRLRRKGGNNNQGSLWACFGTAYRIEFSVSCGGPKPKKRTGNASEITYTESFI